MGNTFVHYGLYERIKHADAANADIAIIEYAINDRELINAKANEFWACGYEGLVRRIRRQNPAIWIFSVILYPRSYYLRNGHHALSANIAFLTRHYGGEDIDINYELARDNGGALPGDAQIYRDGTHYNAAYQEKIGRIIAGRIAASVKTPQDGYLPYRLNNQEYSNAKVLGDTLADMAVAEAMTTLSNSRVEISALTLAEGQKMSFWLKGQIVSLIYGATPRDGVLRLTIDQQPLLISAYRRAFTRRQSG